MKRNCILLISAWMFLVLSAFSQTTDNFDSRSGVSLGQVKGYLQNHCWFFPDFEVNNGAWVPGIDGDGAMVSGTSNNESQSSGIYTPLLDVWGNITISFKYKFDSELGNGVRRWMKIYLTDQDNNVLGLLDQVEFTAISAGQVYSYNKSFTAGSAYYKVYINYQGVGGSTRIAIDDLNISASRVYDNGCNEAPVAVNDVISGQANRHASGQIAQNDYDPNGDNFTGYVIAGSSDGTVVLNDDNTFTFTPNPGFSGSSTKFTYQICDAGFGPLCSNIATVTINFPTNSMLPASLVDFGGVYRSNGLVEIGWATTFEQQSDRFEVERSLDGQKWVKTGSVKAQGTSTVKKSYNYVDDVGRNTANKKDLYYRLKLVDMDGKTAISRILVVRVYNTASVKMISVTPNPAKNDITTHLQLNNRANVTIKVLNGSGSEVMRKSLMLNEGSSSVLMDGTSKMNPGLYFLEVIVNSKETMIVKLVKE